MMRAPKWWRYLRAKLGGYFWLPCNLCGESFGGQEPSGLIWLSETKGRGVCVLCAVERQGIAERALAHTEMVVVVDTQRATHRMPYLAE